MPSLNGEKLAILKDYKNNSTTNKKNTSFPDWDTSLLTTKKDN